MTINKWLALAACVCMASVTSLANAEIIYDVTGPSPFGFANQNPAAAGWSQTATFTNVTISAPLADLTAGAPLPGQQGTVYLMNQIGPGATAANEVAPPVHVSGLTSTFTPRVFFSGLTLGPGNYYIVWVSVSTDDLSMSMQGSGSASSTLASGVTDLGNSSGSTPAGYPPATAALVPVQPSNNYFLTVSGTRSGVAIPTLSTAGVAGLATILALLTFLLLRRKFH